MYSIDAKQYNFLQQNSPGNDGYGQVGSKGDTGINGNSIYFTPYIFKIDGILNDECRTLIAEGKELSDNDFYDKKDVTYKTNDLIIDKIGNVYTLHFDEDTGELENAIFLSNIFSQGSIIGNSLTCVIRCDESVDSSAYYKRQPNSEYLGEYDTKTCSPYIYHRDRYIKRLCGSWVYFSVVIPESEYGDFIYKYTLLFPNGQKLERITENTSCELFVDNRYVYSCRPSDASLNELTLATSYVNINNSNEYEYEVSNLISNYIENECTAYVEITDKESRSVYRVYANSIIRPLTTNPAADNNTDNNG